VHLVGAQAATHDVTHVADKSARSSSDSIAATGRKQTRERRGRFERTPNIGWVKRRSIDGPSSKKI
jgi:hypothetical protein